MVTVERNGTAIYQFVWDYLDSNAYVICEGKEALIVDPISTDEFWQYLDESGIETAVVFLTHEHFDHINGLNKLRDKIPCTVYAHAVCSRNIGLENGNLSRIANVITQCSDSQVKSKPLLAPFVCKPAEITFEDVMECLWHDHHIRLIHTPGHSAGSICMTLDEKLMFSGDTLLTIPTITRFPGGSREAFANVTVPRLNDLEGIRYDFPGHGVSGIFIEMLWLNELLKG